jgi:four helix bundle protein
METQLLIARSKKFALRIIKLVDAMPKTVAGYAIGRQIIRSGTSVAANYRASQHARSKAEFISKISIVIEEADETMFWLDLIIDSGLMQKNKIESLFKESQELLAIFCQIKITAQKKK